jgi:hypothetical protein
VIDSHDQPFRYRSGGIEIRSDRPLPGLHPAENTRSHHVLSLTTGQPARVPDRMPSGEVILEADFDRRIYCGVRDDEGYILRFPNLCDVRVATDLRTGECHLDPSADPDLVAVLLAGTTLAFVLALAGRCVLHASAVEVGGRALAFVGHSGMGKSTLTLAACGAGARLVSEDVLVAVTHGEPRCLPGNTDVRLRKGALSLLEGLDWPSFSTGDQRRAVQPPLSDLHEVPLDTIVIPHPNRKAHELTAEVMPTARAVMRLIAFPRVLGLVDPNVSRRQFEAVGRIVRSVPVLVASVPWGPPFRPDLGAELLRLMRHT